MYRHREPSFGKLKVEHNYGALHDREHLYLHFGVPARSIRIRVTTWKRFIRDENARRTGYLLRIQIRTHALRSLVAMEKKKKKKFNETKMLLGDRGTKRRKKKQNILKSVAKKNEWKRILWVETSHTCKVGSEGCDGGDEITNAIAFFFFLCTSGTI